MYLYLKVKDTAELIRIGNAEDLGHLSLNPSLFVVELRIEIQSCRQVS